jgi:SAM-dependent methyltransferase
MTRWTGSDVPRGEDYDRRFDELAARGHDMHGEADFVDSFGPAMVLDAGCGTGRVAIELSRRGREVVGVDQDPVMLEAARRKAPDVSWVLGDLADPDILLGHRFDIVVLAGNVLIFVQPGTEGAVIANLSRLVSDGGLVIAGYSLRPGGFGLEEHDSLARQSGLALVERWATWDRQPYVDGGDYAVSVHRRVAAMGDGPAG